MKLRLSMLCVISICCFGLAALVCISNNASPILGFLLGGATAAACNTVWTWDE